MQWLDRIPAWAYIVVGAALIALSGFLLHLEGHVFICKCGYVKLWQGIVQSSENSQHISDWYTFSHIIHGFGFYWIFRRLFKKFPVRLRGMLAIIPEAAWEVFENSDFIINRYREATISLDYFGDSVINSMADVAAMVVGFYFASRLPVWVTVAITIFLEIFTMYFIRDNLTLNIIMLLYPFQAIKQWQMGA